MMLNKLCLLGDSVLITKERGKLFHVVSGNDIPDGEGGTFIEVSKLDCLLRWQISVGIIAVV